jgi:beta-mannosidase
MNQMDIHSNWKIRWCDGQRGGMPHYIHTPDEPPAADVKGLAKPVADGYDPRKWIEASVPGEVHNDLMRAGILPSPYEGTGVLAGRWAEECFWFYRTEFDAPEAAGAPLARLVFEGLDYSAVIYLNGEEIARHENAFCPCSVDVAGRLRERGNVLTVRLESGLFAVCDRPIRDYFTATLSVDTLLHKRNWMRKCQSQFEWDWSPRLLNIGITGPVRLVWEEALLVSGCAVQAALEENLERGSIRVRAFAAQEAVLSGGAALRVTVAGETHVFPFAAIPEDGVLEGRVTVERPELWWPAGFGRQALYTVEIEVTAAGRSVYACSKRVGFRHVRVDRSPHEKAGRYFVFVVNREPVFLRGANLVPTDLLATGMTAERYRTLVDLALSANFNFLRIWGGGLYESDALYDYCDERGVLLWQEFIGACGVIPVSDEALRRSIEEEAVYNIRRLGSHPSLAAWCGSNETVWMTRSGWDDMHAREDFPLYFELYPSLLERETPGVYYQPSSPYSEDSEDYNDFETGDQHPWGVGFANKDSRDYEGYVCRFPNEGGILGPSSLPTMRACLRPGEGVHSFSWQVHDNMLDNYNPGESPDCDLEFWTGLSIDGLSLEEYVYAGGLVQAEGLKRYIENFRRRKFSSSCAVFWMYNDCWPTVRSWTIVDYYLRRTPSYHAVRRAFEPVSAVIAKEEKGYVLYGVNDTREERAGQLRYGVFTTAGTYVLDFQKTVCLPANASVPLAGIPLGAVEDAGGSAGALVFAVLTDDRGMELSRTRYTDALLSELRLEKAAIEVAPCEGGCWMKSEVYTMGVCLDLDGGGAIGDNLFDLYPDQPYFVPSEEALSENAVLFTWNDFVQRIRAKDGAAELSTTHMERKAV